MLRAIVRKGPEMVIRPQGSLCQGLAHCHDALAAAAMPPDLDEFCHSVLPQCSIMLATQTGGRLALPPTIAISIRVRPFGGRPR